MQAGANAIVIACSDASKVTRAIDEAHAKGVVVSCFRFGRPGVEAAFGLCGGRTICRRGHGDGRKSPNCWETRKGTSPCWRATRPPRTFNGA